MAIVFVFAFTRGVAWIMPQKGIFVESLDYLEQTVIPKFWSYVLSGYEEVVDKERWEGGWLPSINFWIFKEALELFMFDRLSPNRNFSDHPFPKKWFIDRKIIHLRNNAFYCNVINAIAEAIAYESTQGWFSWENNQDQSFTENLIFKISSDNKIIQAI